MSNITDEAIRGMLIERKRHSALVEKRVTVGIILMGIIFDAVLIAQVIAMCCR